MAGVEQQEHSGRDQNSKAMSRSTITRRSSAKRRDYSLVSNTVLQDERLSFEARGLFAYMASTEIPIVATSWNLLVELERYGYLKKEGGSYSIAEAHA